VRGCITKNASADPARKLNTILRAKRIAQSLCPFGAGCTSAKGGASGRDSRDSGKGWGRCRLRQSRSPEHSRRRPGLSDRESFDLALFCDGLAMKPDDVALRLRSDPAEAAQICRRLERVGFI
jgi:hypothetical protein